MSSSSRSRCSLMSFRPCARMLSWMRWSLIFDLYDPASWIWTFISSFEWVWSLISTIASQTPRADALLRRYKFWRTFSCLFCIFNRCIPISTIRTVANCIGLSAETQPASVSVVKQTRAVLYFLFTGKWGSKIEDVRNNFMRLLYIWRQFIGLSFLSPILHPTIRIIANVIRQSHETQWGSKNCFTQTSCGFSSL